MLSCFLIQLHKLAGFIGIFHHHVLSVYYTIMFYRYMLHEVISNIKNEEVNKNCYLLLTQLTSDRYYNHSWIHSRPLLTPFQEALQTQHPRLRPDQVEMAGCFSKIRRIIPKSIKRNGLPYWNQPGFLKRPILKDTPKWWYSI